MQFSQPSATLFRPKSQEGAPSDRLSHLAIGAHHDDVEVMAYHGVLACFRRPGNAFGAVVVTDGAGSPRTGEYADFSSAEMCRIREEEQLAAAVVGEYALAALLSHPSGAVKDGSNTDVVADLVQLLKATRPGVAYTHNLADKHETHVAVALRTLEALRSLPPDERPSQVMGCEVWRSLDWLADKEKAVLDCSGHPNLHAALLGVYDSQISGGKRYDVAAVGRCRANATFFESHGVDRATSLTFAMDLTPLVQNVDLDPAEYVLGHIERFKEQVSASIVAMRKG